MKYLVIFLLLIGCVIPVFADLESITFEAPKNPVINEYYDVVITANGIPTDEQFDEFAVTISIVEKETGKILDSVSDALYTGPNKRTILLKNFPDVEYYKEGHPYLLKVSHGDSTFEFEFIPNKTRDNEPQHYFQSDYKKIKGRYENKEFGFGITLPLSMTGFLAEIDNPNIGKTIGIQIHPEFDSNEQCCPSIDTSPVVLLLDSHPKSILATPVPLTGDIYAAFQGYNMNIKIEQLGDIPVLTSTIEIQRAYPPDYPEPIKRIGKFYFINTGNRYLSYGVLASPENYAKYIDTFEQSARSLTVNNAKPVNLDEIFDYPSQNEIILSNGAVLHSRVITPSVIDGIRLDEGSSSLHIKIDEPNSYRSFIVVNIGDLLEAPYDVKFDELKIDSQILENESGRYLVVFYDDSQGPHEISILGSNVVASKVLSPLKQINSGIDSEEIQCNKGLDMIIKLNTNQPVCVKPETKIKLIERGWAKPI